MSGLQSPEIKLEYSAQCILVLPRELGELGFPFLPGLAADAVLTRPCMYMMNKCIWNGTSVIKYRPNTTLTWHHASLDGFATSGDVL